MRASRVAVLAMCLLAVAGLLLVLPTVVESSADLEVDIVISPSTLVLSAPNQWVTVHADIPFSSVQPGSVYLEGIIRATSIFADDRGDLVAKFTAQSVKSIVAPPSAMLVLTGTKKDGVSFWGADTIQVKR